MHITRRDFGKLTAAATGAALLASHAQAGPRRAHGVSAFGDLKYPADFHHFDYANPDAPKGGTFSARGTSASSTFDSLNPYILKGEPAQGMEFTVDTLLASATDEPDAMYGLVAEAIEYPEDRAWARFFLRAEAKFSDATQITADDIVFTFEILRDKGDPRFRILFRDILSATAEDAAIVRFDFAPDAPTRDLPMLAGGLPVLSRAYYADRDFAASTLDPHLGSGPYKVESADPGRQITFVRRDD